jgi:hypothetical protein
MRVSLLTATLHTDRPVRGAASLLRGFFANRQPENVLLHEHGSNEEEHRFVYLYPRVQYRIRDGIARLIGIEEGATAIAHAASGLDSLDLAGWRYRVDAVDLAETEADIADSNESRQYRFVSPWLALSQKNFQRYRESDPRGQVALLERTLIGNILSMCKSLGFRVTEKLETHVRLRPVPVHVKDQQMLGFTGRFSVNFDLVPGLGLGHLVSIGFGDVALSERPDCS